MNSHPHFQRRIHPLEVQTRIPILGLAMFLVGSIVFGVLAYNLGVNKSLMQWDMAIAKTFRTIQMDAPWSWMENLLFGCFLGREVVAMLGAILTIYFLHKRFWRELALVLFSLGGGILLWYFLSQSFDRPRPADHLDVLLFSSPSFPSGSALMAILCYGLVIYLLVPSLPSLFWKWFVALISALAIILTGVSSLLFGTHYVSDVVAGYALGIVWLVLVCVLVEKASPIGNYVGTQNTIALQGFRVPGLFQRRPILGIALILLSLLSLAALSYNVLTEGPLVQLDLSLYKELLTIAKGASPALNNSMLFGFFVGKQMVQIIVMTLSLYFLLQRYWLELAMIQISTQGGGILWNFLIDFFSRSRPAEQLGLGTNTIPSFPSGHALGTMICYGFLTYLLIPKMPSLFWKWALGLSMAALILFEGFSRIFHGNHYLTDVLAGYALGIAWTILVCTVMERLFMKTPNTDGDD